MSVDPGWLARFDRIAAVFGTLIPASAPFRRMDGARAAIEVGLKTLEKEYGLTDAPLNGAPELPDEGGKQ